MTNRVKKQHFVPRFYLANFCDADGYLWTHDSRLEKPRRTLPENTGFETNIYSPEAEEGKRIDYIEETLSVVESAAAPLIQKLLRCESIDGKEKADMALFIACMFARSPAQLRQNANFFGSIAGRAAMIQLDRIAEEQKDNEESEYIFEILKEKGALELQVDRRVGLMSFLQIEPIARIILKMTWSFEISRHEEIITSDNPVFWVPSEKIPASPYGFGVGHPQAVIPFPLSPSVMLRIDHGNPRPWAITFIDRQKAKLANRLRAQYKDHCLYYRRHHDGLHRLGMKYAKPVKNLDVGYAGPDVTVVRKLKREPGDDAPAGPVAP